MPTLQGQVHRLSLAGQRSLLGNENIFRHGFFTQEGEGLQKHKLLISTAAFVKDNSCLFEGDFPRYQPTRHRIRTALLLLIATG